MDEGPNPFFQTQADHCGGGAEKFGVGSLVIENLQILGCEDSFISINPWYESLLGNLV